MRWFARKPHLALLLSLLLYLPVALVRADGDLPPAERKQIEEQVKALDKKIDDHFNASQPAKALPLAEEKLKLLWKLHPQGHKDLATCMNTVGYVFHLQGQYDRSLSWYEQSLAMYRKLYPPEQYPQGHVKVATGILYVGGVLDNMGQYGKALSYFEQALAMNRKLYPPDKYPEGHADLAGSLGMVARLLSATGQLGKAVPYYEETLAMRKKLYPPERFPDGHPTLATSLNNLGLLFAEQGDYARGLPYLEQALEMERKLHPPERFPRGSEDVASSLNNLGGLFQQQGAFGKALPYFDQALAMRRKLYPADAYPGGHPNLAASLDNMGGVLQELGSHGKARVCYEEALAMRQKLFPADRYPNGHPSLANSIGNLGVMLANQGEYRQALPYYEQALAMRRKIYPPERFPRGHPSVATCLNNMGYLAKKMGAFENASRNYEEALAMRRNLYPSERYPRGHPDLAESLVNLGVLLTDQKKYARALACYEEALAMRRKLYPPERYPAGHPDLARVLNNLGTLLQDQGDYDKALDYFEQAQAINRKLYPSGLYPLGHPDLAMSLYNLATVHDDRKDPVKALACAEQATEMYRRLLDAYAAGASEAATLNFIAALPGPMSRLLSITRHGADSDLRACEAVWRSKGMVSRLMERRQRALVNSDDPQVQALLAEYRDVRRQLGQLLLGPADGKATTSRLAAEKTRRKEELERELAARLPAFAHMRELDRLGPSDLASRLPAHSAFIDLIQYEHVTHDPEKPGRAGLKWTLHYAAFLIQPGQPIQRMELGPAKDIDAAIVAWRKAVIAQRPDETEAAAVGRLVWQPLRARLAKDISTIWLSPDAGLTQLPWAALPGARAGSVLLEDHLLVSVPHGPFLLEQLSAAKTKSKPSGSVLVLGGVDYDQKAAAVGEPPGTLLTLRGPALSDKQAAWAMLPGTEKEYERIVGLAEHSGSTVIHRDGQAASVPQLLADLPKASVAHLATHGFFADRKFRSALQVDEKSFQAGSTERAAPGTRSPLVLSGLVLAGANRSGEEGTGGILTAEAIASLPLGNLDLAVLSACETGLGETAGGEGVFGLQRAFHLGGTHTVVASLWKVPDEATQELMARFYDNLWNKHMSKGEALRQAQLSMLHAARASSGKRGLDFLDPADQPASNSRQVWQWAAWTLSGDPGDVAQVKIAGRKAPAATSRASSLAAPADGGFWLIGAGVLVLVLGRFAVWQASRWRCR